MNGYGGRYVRYRNSGHSRYNGNNALDLRHESRNNSRRQETGHRFNNQRKGRRSDIVCDSWRDSNNYREEYFKRNRGFAGLLYFCSQCFKPMVNKQKIQVDHIVPPSRFSRRRQTRKGIKNTSFRSRMLNHSFNCAAICSKCNQRKSNKMGLWVLRGMLSKSVEVAANIAQIAVVLGFATALFIAPLPFRIAGHFMRRRRHTRRYAY